MYRSLARDFARRGIEPSAYFLRFDPGNTGALETDSFRNAVTKLSKNISLDDLDSVVEELKVYGMVDYP
jgi:Ca2+-binding EF-hand superfamily protein